MEEKLLFFSVNFQNCHIYNILQKLSFFNFVNTVFLVMFLFKKNALVKHAILVHMILEFSRKDWLSQKLVLFRGAKPNFFDQEKISGNINKNKCLAMKE
ncbi:hypothetical protein BpHYR1_004536 [Brachionus plicatilis]|uniref:Uncharacterized protein n=1 Tax=Brachionus plicatilis TaxID=10195 RepID=A0A3M7QAT8_BRAPC|nr:hypothetical protein BpHYR1_004536 [Brachionus plicatilis]